MSAWTCHQSEGKAAQKIVPPRLRTPCWKGPGADSEEKREPASDINTCAVDSLKVLDPERPIREADIKESRRHNFCSTQPCRTSFLLPVRKTPPKRGLSFGLFGQVRRKVSARYVTGR
jgi:hypothetical protein